MNCNVPIKETSIPSLSAERVAQLAKITVAGVITVLSGCSSLGVGNSEYACQGMPDGVQCMSTRDVYDATNDGQVPRSITAEEARKGVTSVPPSSGVDMTAQDQHAAREAAFVNNYVAPYLPDRPIPIRTPAQVMRIWVAPWEDTNGDLNATGYLYTEVEPRRWVIGDAAPAPSPTLRPLQVTRPVGRSSTSAVIN